MYSRIKKENTYDSINNTGVHVNQIPLQKKKKERFLTLK